MPPGPPPWRVFDGPPAPEPDSSGLRPSAGRASDGDRAAAAAGPAGIVGALGIRPEVLAGAAAALGGLVLAWLLATGGPGGSTSLGGGTELITDAIPSGSSSVVGEIVVDVVGAVLRPGVYHLPSGSRIADAIAAAGGFGPRVAAERVDRELNLASTIHDGEQVIVPSRDDSGSSPVPSGTSGAASGRLIDINSSSESELDTLPGIGPATAAKIVASRAGQRFRSVDDLLERKLVGQKTFDAIKSLVTVGS